MATNRFLHLSDAQLVQEYRTTNSPLYFEELVRRYGPGIRKYVVSFVGEDIADDVMQDIWVALLDALNEKKYKEREHFDRFLIRMAHYQALKKLRDLHPERYIHDTSDLPDETQNAEEYIVSREKALVLGRMIRLLLGKQEAKVFILHAFRGNSFEEISKRMNIAESTARNAYHHALEKVNKWPGKP